MLVKKKNCLCVDKPLLTLLNGSLRLKIFRHDYEQINVFELYLKLIRTLIKIILTGVLYNVFLHL